MNIEEDIKNLKAYIELVIEKNYCDCNELNTICYGKYGDGSKNVAKSIENILTAYEKEKEKNNKLLEQNKDMKALFNIQASIAKELDFNTNEKMVKFKDEYYVPDTMAINANIGEPKTIELKYISATKYLTKFDEEE